MWKRRKTLYQLRDIIKASKQEKIGGLEGIFTCIDCSSGFGVRSGGSTPWAAAASIRANSARSCSLWAIRAILWASILWTSSRILWVSCLSCSRITDASILSAISLKILFLQRFLLIEVFSRQIKSLLACQHIDWIISEKNISLEVSYFLKKNCV